MKKILNNLWKGLLIWVSGYLSFMAFIFVAIYMLVKEQDNEELQKETKKAFIVTIVFTVISLLLSFSSEVADLFGKHLAVTDAYSVITSLVNIAKIVVYVTMTVLFIVSSRKNSNDEVEVVETEDSTTKEE